MPCKLCKRQNIQLQLQDQELYNVKATSNELQSKLERDLSKLQQSLVQKQDELTAATSKSRELEAKIIRVEETKKDLEKKFGSLESSHKSELAKSRKLSQECAASKDTIKQLCADIDTKSSEVQAASKEIQVLRRKLDQTRADSERDVDELQQKIAGLEEDIVSFNEATRNQSRSISNLEEMLEQERSKVSSLEERLRVMAEESTLKANDMNCIIATLEEDKKDLSNSNFSFPTFHNRDDEDRKICVRNVVVGVD